MSAGGAVALRASLKDLWRLWRRLAGYLRGERRLIAFSALALLIEVLLRLVEPWPLKLIFDRVIAGRHHHSAWRIPFFDHYHGNALMLLAVMALVGFAAVRAFFENSTASASPPSRTAC